jgi:Fe-S cluster assembly protein SufB
MGLAQSAVGSFTEDAVRGLSRDFHEPQWLTEFRLGAYAQFASSPTEKNTLYTKYAGISAFDASRFSITSAKPKVDFKEFFGGYLSGKERNILLQANETDIHAELDEQIASKGVILQPIGEALETHAEILKAALDRELANREDDKFSDFTNAFFNSGALVYVPRGVELDVPLRKMTVTESPKNAVVEKLVVVAEEGARLVLLEELYSKPGGGPSLVTSRADVQAGPASSVDYSSIQLLDPSAVHLSNRTVSIGADSRASVSSLALGSGILRSRMNFYLNGRGATAEGFEIFFTDEKQRYDFESNLLHNSPDTTGSTQARGVLKGESQSIFKGMIRIANNAKNSRAYLAHHAMLLERTAKSDGIPGLEILTNEVKATHSASVAQIDDEQLFYLMARGLSADEAKKMVVLGFFEPVLSRIPIEQTREGARFIIEGKWQGERRRLVDRETLIELTGETVPEAKSSEDIFERHYKYR